MVQVIYAVVMMVASYLISKAMQPKPQDAKPATLGDIDIPQADEGTAQAVIFGDCWSGDWMVLGYGNFSTEAIRK